MTKNPIWKKSFMAGRQKIYFEIYKRKDGVGELEISTIVSSPGREAHIHRTSTLTSVCIPLVHGPKNRAVKGDVVEFWDAMDALVSFTQSAKFQKAIEGKK